MQTFSKFGSLQKISMRVSRIWMNASLATVSQSQSKYLDSSQKVATARASFVFPQLESSTPFGFQSVGNRLSTSTLTCSLNLEFEMSTNVCKLSVPTVPCRTLKKVSSN